MARSLRRRRRDLGLEPDEVEMELGWPSGRLKAIESGRGIGAIDWLEVLNLCELLAVGEVITWSEVLA
jgi:hypothetical protein